MRFSFSCALFALSLCGAAFAQNQTTDTNFSAGPQYLITNGPALFAHPISTPSLSLNTPALQTGAGVATATLNAGADTQTASPQSVPQPDLFPIYYGPAASVSIETNSLESPQSEPSPSPSPGAPKPTGLGAGPIEVGVWQVSTIHSLRHDSSGHDRLSHPAAVGDTNAQPRLYTNADIDRLHAASENP